MRSRSPFVVVGSLLLLLACAKKGPAIGDHKLVVPAGCKAESVPPGGSINCEGGARALSWLNLTESTPDQALDHGESIITEAMAKWTISKSKPACTVAGQAMTCRRLDMKSKSGAMVALLAAGTIDGKPYYVECSYAGTGAIDPVCNDLFSLK